MVSINSVPSGPAPQGFFPEVTLPAMSSATASGAPRMPLTGGTTEPTPLQEAETPLTREDAESLVEDMNQVLEGVNRRLKFGLYGETEQFYVQVIDRASNSTVKMLPARELLDLRDRIFQQVGMLVDEQG